MSFEILDRPQILRCTMCRHALPLTEPSMYNTAKPKRVGVHRATCPECQGPMRILCGAGCKRDKPDGVDYCESIFVLPGGRCRRHGKNAPKGVDSPSFKHGRRSKFMLERYSSRFEEALSDHDAQHTQRLQLAVVAAMEQEMLQRIETGESAESWKLLKSQARDLRRNLAAIKQAGSAGTEDGRQEAGRLAQDLLRFLETDLLPVIHTGAGDEASRQELVKLYVQRTKLIKTEQDSQKTVPIETLFLMQSQFLQIIMLHLADQPRTRTLMASALRDLSIA